MTITAPFCCRTVNDGVNAPFTELRYARSAFGVSSSALVPPADLIEAPAEAWTVGMPQTTAEKPFLWMRSQTFTWQNGQAVGGQATYSCVTGYNGESTLRADFVDEMTQMACHYDGTPEDSGWQWTTRARLWYGLEAEQLTGAAVTASTGIGLTPLVVISDDGLSVAVTFTAGNITGDTATIVLTLTSQRGSRQCTARVVKVRGGADGSPATVYQLVCSENAVKKSATGTYSTSTLTVSIVKTEGNVRTVISTNAARQAEGLSVVFYNDGVEDTDSDHFAFPTFYVSDAQPQSGVRIELWKGNVLLDAETIPVLTDGAKGDDAEVYAILANNDYINESTHYIEGLSIIKSTGSSVATQSLSSFTFEVSGDINGVVEADDAQVNIVDYNTYPLSVGGTLILKAKKSGVEVARKTFMVIQHRGKTGRFYYYDGEWSATKLYIMTDTQAPFVKASNGSFYMLDNAANNSDNTTSRNQNPTVADNGNPWSLMESAQQYYISKATFGSYAQFGAFCVNGDWQFSTYGRIIGHEYNTSQWDNPAIFSETEDGDGEANGVPAYTLFKPLLMPSGIHQYDIGNSVYVTNSEYAVKISNLGNLSGNVALRVSGNVNSGNGSLFLKIVQGNYSHECEIDTSAVSSAIFVFTVTADVTIQAKVTGTATAYITAVEQLAFVPDYAVDGKTGQTFEHDHVLTGRLIAGNVVRNYVFFFGGAYSRKVYYIKELNDWSETAGYRVGDYVVPPNPNVDPWFSDANMLLCTYDADEIICYVDGTGVDGPCLPDPEDFEGKTVDVLYTGNGTGTMILKCVVADATGEKKKGIASLIPNTSGDIVFPPGQPSATCSVNIGVPIKLKAAKFGSSYVWIVLTA